MQRSPTNLFHLGNDVIFLIACMLMPADIAALEAVNKPLNAMMKQESIKRLWKIKLRQHFPHHYNNLVNQQDVNWKLAFEQAWRDDYHS